MSGHPHPIPEPGRTRPWEIRGHDRRQPAARAGAPRTRRRPPFRYNGSIANEIEARWQQSWHEQGTFDAPNPHGALSEDFDAVRDRPHTFVMDMFPYPSGAGLHVGHPLGYIGTDVYARYLRMRGENVLHTMGFDAFGLPAEQYALQTGQHPATTTDQQHRDVPAPAARAGTGT